MTHKQLVNLVFAECNRMREVLGDTVRIAGQIQEIAMNAAVMASHTGQHTRVFTEIARQIDHTAAKIFACSADTREEIDQASSLVLKAVLDQAKLEKYQAAQQSIHGFINRRLVDAQITHRELGIHQKMTQVSHRLFRCQSLVKTLIQLQNRTFSIVNSMRIESISLNDNQQSTILSLAETLESNHHQSNQKLEFLLNMTASMRSRIRLASHHREDRYHETRQAV